MNIAILLLAAFAPLVDAKSWKAGMASVDISPTEPIYLNGYGAPHAPINRSEAAALG